MEFDNEFSVSSPIEKVWDTLMDVEEVAPCMPGAEVLEQTGDNSYKVSVKVRLGPVSMQYRGDVEIVDTDPGSHTAKLVAKATEARGQGTANAEIGMQLAERNGSTHATLTTDLRLSGRAAAMGVRGEPGGEAGGGPGGDRCGLVADRGRDRCLGAGDRARGGGRDDCDDQRRRPERAHQARRRSRRARARGRRGGDRGVHDTRAGRGAEDAAGGTAQAARAGGGRACGRR